ncbi:unnamed protein product [Pedinophyceae sp. YPF-701]|nr:unnamed protein product [Pedinophyceae sp. YPF-701]
MNVGSRPLRVPGAPRPALAAQTNRGYLVGTVSPRHAPPATAPPVAPANWRGRGPCWTCAGGDEAPRSAGSGSMGPFPRCRAVPRAAAFRTAARFRATDAAAAVPRRPSRASAPGLPSRAANRPEPRRGPPARARPPLRPRSCARRAFRAPCAMGAATRGRPRPRAAGTRRSFDPGAAPVPAPPGPSPGPSPGARGPSAPVSCVRAPRRAESAPTAPRQRAAVVLACPSRSFARRPPTPRDPRPLPRSRLLGRGQRHARPVPPAGRGGLPDEAPAVQGLAQHLDAAPVAGAGPRGGLHGHRERRGGLGAAARAELLVGDAGGQRRQERGRQPADEQGGLRAGRPAERPQRHEQDAREGRPDRRPLRQRGLGERVGRDGGVGQRHGQRGGGERDEARLGEPQRAREPREPGQQQRAADQRERERERQRERRRGQARQRPRGRVHDAPARRGLRAHAHRGGPPPGRAALAPHRRRRRRRRAARAAAAPAAAQAAGRRREARQHGARRRRGRRAAGRGRVRVRQRRLGRHAGERGAAGGEVRAGAARAGGAAAGGVAAAQAPPTPPGPPRRPRQEAKSVQEAGGVPPQPLGRRDLAGGGAGGEQPAAGGAEPARAADANGAAAYGGRPGDAPASVPAGAAAMGSGVQQLWQQQAREALQHLRSVLEMASTSTMGMQLAQGLASLIGSQMAASMCPRSSAAHPPPANPAVSGPPASPATASGSQVRTQTYGAPAWPGARYQGTAAAAAPPQLQQPSRAGHQPQHRLPAASGGPWFSQKQALENLSMAVRSSLANATSGGAAGAARVPAPAYSTPTPAYSAPAPQPMQQVANPLWSALAQVQQAMLQRGPQAGVPAVSMPASQPPTTAMWGAQPLLNPAAIAALQQQLPAAGAALHAGAMHPGGGVPSSVPGAQAARQPPMSQPPAGDAQPLQPPASGEPRANPLPPPPSWGAPATQRDACATFEPNGGPAGGRKGAATETARRGPRTRGGNPPSSGRAGQTEANGSASGSDECMEDDDSKGLQSSSSLRVRSETRHTLPPSSGAAPAAGGTEPGGRQRALKKAATGPPEGATRSAKRQKAGADGRRGGRNRGSDSGSNSPPGGRAAGDATGESPERVEEDSLTSGKGAT